MSFLSCLLCSFLFILNFIYIYKFLLFYFLLFPAKLYTLTIKWLAYLL